MDWPWEPVYVMALTGKLVLALIEFFFFFVPITGVDLARKSCPHYKVNLYKASKCDCKRNALVSHNTALKVFCNNASTIFQPC